MREAIAGMVCLLALGIVTLLSYVFAVRHNSPARNTPPIQTQTSQPAPQPNPREITTGDDRGRRIFEDQKCQTCHSINGIGNPRYPLDGVGSRLNTKELRDWITGTGVSENELSPSIRRRKESYQNLNEGEMDALVQYLRMLHSEPILQK
jgi:mono/diheme cytochrome c family protein